MDPEAQQLFLRGLAANRKYTVPDLTQSVRYFEQAAAKDPGSPRPWWGLGLSYMRLHHLRQMTLREAHEKAQAAARRALEIDARCAEAHTVMGWVYWRDEKAADAEFRQAITLNPNSAEAWDFYGVFLGRHRRQAESMDASMRAWRLDPLNSDIALHLYYTYLGHRRYDDAMALVLRERLHPIGPYDHRIGHVLLAKGDCAGAVEAIRRAKLPEPNVSLAVALVCSGNRDEARKQLAQLEQAAAAGKASPAHVARVYVALGEKSAALDWLERVGPSDPWPHDLGVNNAVWNPLRSEPRFQALRERIGADESVTAAESRISDRYRPIQPPSTVRTVPLT
jgi:Flp pilus assembly protein TadD